MKDKGEKRMERAVIFDLDGTLLNTLDDLWKAMNIALVSYHYPQHDKEACKRFVGHGIYKLVESSLPVEARDRDNVLKVKEVFDAYYQTHNQQQTKPYPFIEELLKELKAKGIKCGVVTNKAENYAKQLIQAYFPNQVEVVIGQREGMRKKPYPDSLLEAIAALQVKKEQCIYVGDSEVDMEVAMNAGVTPIGVLWGFRTKEVLQEAGAHYMARTVEELKNIIYKEIKL